MTRDMPTLHLNQMQRTSFQATPPQKLYRPRITAIATATSDPFSRGTRHRFPCVVEIANACCNAIEAAAVRRSGSR